MNEIKTADHFEGKGCACYATSANECGCEEADWTPVEVYKLREDAKQLASRLTALELHSTSELARLEQERDEALSQIAQAENRAERFCQERDIAEDERIDMAQQLESEKECHARCQNERDEAREDLEFRRELYKVQDKFLDDARRERDEARNAIVGWENKWKCAVEMAARAELERDDARGALMKIEDLFIDGDDIYADRENMGMIAKTALEEIK